MEEHLEDVKELIRRLKRCGFKLNLKKCEFGIDLEKESIEVLGFKISNGKLTIPPKKLIQLTELTPPKNLKDAQSLLGNLVYYRPMLSLKIHNSINELYGMVKDFEWNDHYKHHFDIVIKELKEKKQEASFPKENEISILFTDASAVGIGAALFNLNITKYLKPCKEIQHIKSEKNKYLNEKLPRFENKLKIICYESNIIKFIEKMSLTLDIKIKEGEMLNFLFSRTVDNLDFLYRLEYDQEPPGQFLNKTINRILKEEIQDGYYYDHFMLQYFSALAKRQISFILNENVVVYIGYKTGKSNLNVYYDKEQDEFYMVDILEECHELKPIKKEIRIEDFEKTDLIKGFFKALKEPNVHENVRIIGYYSKTVNKSLFSKDGIIYLELFAVYQALKNYEYIISPELTLCLIDNAAVTAMLKNKESKVPKLEKLTFKLTCSYGRHVKFLSVPTKQNLSDFLSRLVPEKYEELNYNIFKKPSYEEGDLKIYPLGIEENYVNKINLVEPDFGRFSEFFSTKQFIEHQINENVTNDLNPKHPGGGGFHPPPLVFLR